MMFYTVKIILSALLILAITEISKRTGFWGALLASLPLVSLISIVWIYWETRDIAKIQAFSRGVFWLVLPSLGFFIALPPLLSRCGFWPGFLASIVITFALYGLMLFVLPRWGIKL